jgi:hypothetical protein
MRCLECRCALARANHVFCTDKKRIRTENAVIDKNKNSAGVSYEIVDCVRMCFSSARNRRCARTVFRPRKIAVLQQRGRQLSRHFWIEGKRA